jgi:hypothetical protein
LVHAVATAWGIEPEGNGRRFGSKSAPLEPVMSLLGEKTFWTRSPTLPPACGSIRRRLCGHPLGLGNDRELIVFEDDVIYVGDDVIPRDDELPSVGANILVLGFGDLEEDVAVCEATFAHDVHVRIHWARFVGVLDLFVQLPMASLVLGDPLVSAVHRRMICRTAWRGPGSRGVNTPSRAWGIDPGHWGHRFPAPHGEPAVDASCEEDRMLVGSRAFKAT